MPRYSRFHTSILSFLLFILAPYTIANTPVNDDSNFEINSITDEPRLRGNQHPDWFSHTFLNLKEDLEEAKQEGKLGIIVYFGQVDCAYCEALLNINFGKEKEIVDYTRKYFNVIAIDIWGSKEVTDMNGNVLSEREFAEQEKTNFTPTLFFYVDEGKEVLRLNGYYPPYNFQAALEYVADGYYKKESLREYTARADPPGKFEMDDMNTQTFFEPQPYALDRTHFAASSPLVVFFEHKKCHACDILHTDPINDKVVRKLLENFEAIQLDMKADTPVLTPDGKNITARQWAKKLEIFYAPTLLFFDENGKEVLRVDSMLRLYRLRGILEYVYKKGYLEAPTFQRWRETLQQEQL
jgi:thioredoxin-related protein